MKIVINKCRGGFGLSKKAYKCLGLEWDGHGYEYEDKRADPKLIDCIKKLGTEEASGRLAELKIVTIPDNIEWTIEEYDGVEWIAEKHREWS